MARSRLRVGGGADLSRKWKDQSRRAGSGWATRRLGGCGANVHGQCMGAASARRQHGEPVKGDRPCPGAGCIEQPVMVHGGTVLFVGTDDEDERTNLSGLDLFPDVLRHLSGLANLRGHPFGFYQRMGFSIVGVVPDANGFGRPDILMAKRVATY